MAVRGRGAVRQTEGAVTHHDERGASFCGVLMLVDQHARLLGSDELPNAVGRHNDEQVAIGAGARGWRDCAMVDVRVGDHADMLALTITDGARHGEAYPPVCPHA